METSLDPSENWKLVVGFETSHEVSSLGRVQTLPRTYIGGRKHLDGRPSVMSIRRKRLRTRMNGHGYEVVDLSFNGRSCGKLVHRLVCEAFHGEAPTARHEVNHKNGRKMDNRADNLEWVTPSQNSQHAYDSGLRPPLQGRQVHTAKLDDEKVREVRKLIAAGMSYRAIGRQFGVTSPQILHIAHGRAWRHVV